MKTVINRICRLEDRFGVVDEKKRIVLIMSGGTLALPEDQCVEILRECDFMPKGRMGFVGLLTKIPKGLNAKELERFLRESGAVLCGP